MIYECCDPRRLAAVEQAGVRNGIAWLEVSDDDAPTEALRQRTLFVRLLLAPPGGPGAFGPGNVAITGGERIPRVEVEWVAPATALPPGEAPSLVDGLEDLATVLVVRTVDRGDFSTYTLSLVTGPGDPSPPAGFDPRLASVDFSFKVDCTPDFDCAVVEECPPLPGPSPTIDYTARDWPTFRRLLLDRLGLVAPDWQERNPADAAMALVEVMAWLADEMSYRLDAATTEGYLATARRRPSLRRLARLVDYVVHEGCNARAWARVFVDAEDVPVPADLTLLTRVPGLAGRVEPGSAEVSEALAAGAETFAPVTDLEDRLLHQSVETLQFHTWGDADCCLPAGATSATLLGHHAAQLVPGSVVVLAEVVGPATGAAADADPTRRWPVRLVASADSEDPSGGLFAEVPDNDAVEVTEIEWHRDDALPFPLCVTDPRQPGVAISEVWGNVVLVDHGRTVLQPDLGTVPEPVLQVASGNPAQPCTTRERDPVAVRFRPVLDRSPLTHSTPSPAAVAADSASGELPAAVVCTEADPRRALPSITLTSELDSEVLGWSPIVDLLATDGDDTAFVVETEHDRTARLRFGDGVHGRRPSTGTSFAAEYRIGNGPAGNVGREVIVHAVTSDTSVTGASNPLPAVGGTAPEEPDAVRRDAPEAFLVQERAVTTADYAEVTERHRDVQRAAGTFRWTGSWHTVFVTADRVGGAPVDETFEADLRDHVEPFRMAGYDLEVDAPRFVPLEVELHVCVGREHFRPHVRAAVLEVLGSGIRPDGTRGLFHPDNFTFAQPVFLSTIVAAAQGVAGVDSVEVVLFRRQRSDDDSAIDTGVLEMGRLEVARLDNNPNFPERGTLVVTAGGGK